MDFLLNIWYGILDFLDLLEDLFSEIPDRFPFLADFFYQVNHALRKFLSFNIYRLPRKRNGRKRMIRVSETLHLLLFPFVLLYSEVLLRTFNKTGVFQNLIYPILFSIAYGVILNIPTTIFKEKINRIITAVSLLLIAILYNVEAIIKDTYFTYMPIYAVAQGAEGVATGYLSDAIRAIVGNLGHIFLFLLPVILYLIFGKKNLRPLRYKPIFIGAHVLIAVIFMGIGTIAASHGKTSDQYGAQYEFNSATIVFGLPTSVRLSFERQGKVQSSFVTTTVATSEDHEMETAESVESSTESLEAPVSYGKNEMGIDYDSILASTNNSAVSNITSYIQSLTPSDQNKYTGLFEGKNLILICAEAFSDAVIDPDLTPTLYRLQHNGFYFSDYYQPSWGGSTSTGEYSFITGLVPGQSIKCMQDSAHCNMYFTLGNSLQRLGYANGSFHNGDYNYYSRQDTHPNLGYGQWIARGNGIHELTGLYWPQDNVMFTDIVKLYAEEEPFSLYFMTVNGHSPYTMDEWYLPDRYLEFYQNNAKREYNENTLVYLAMQYTLEVALTQLIDELEELGIADNTVIALTADHYPYGLDESAAWGNSSSNLLDLYGVSEATEPWDHDHNSLIIWSECLEHEDKDYVCEISSPTYSLDIVPTLLNLFGIDYDSRLLPGRDVFSKQDPLVLWNSGHWITEYGTYNATTYTFTPKEGVQVPDGYVDSIKSIVSNKITLSNVIIDTNYYGLLFGEDTYTSDNRKEELFEAAVRLGTSTKPEGTDSSGTVVTE